MIKNFITGFVLFLLEASPAQSQVLNIADHKVNYDYSVQGRVSISENDISLNCKEDSDSKSDFTSSNLPIVIIDTYGQTINNEPKITAGIKIIYNGPGKRNNITDPANVYDGVAGIEVRGRYSASLPQKSYNFETRDSQGANLNVSLLGMPEENDWVLLENYSDKSFLRNVLAFEIFRKMGHYAPRLRFCEVVLNDEYQGIYLLCEKIKQDKNRVNISKLNPDENTGDDLTGGYIFKNDYYTKTDSWLSNFSPLNKPGAKVYFVYYDPKPDELTPDQKNYLKNYVDAFESTLYSSNFRDRSKGYKAWIDAGSFVDYFIIGEVSRNVDAYKKSRYFYKDRDSKDKLIYSGPVWDYDWAWKDLTEDCIHFDQTDGSGWAYKINECYAWPVPPSWEIRFMQDPEFAYMVYERYTRLRKNILDINNLNNIIDSVALLLDEAQQRHYEKWPILGVNVDNIERGEQPLTYAGVVEKLKAWIERRLTWLDNNITKPDYVPHQDYSPKCRAFPNPATDILFIESDTIIDRITLFNLTGIPALTVSEINNSSVQLNLSGLKPGIYIGKINFNHGESVTVRIVKK
ncbi:MAG: CotH kinase family protein [Bacteroidales bacterium]|nr:CotH kinase family protein [Bacteroidales bacterium]